MSSKYNREDPEDLHFGSHINDTGVRPVGYRILVEIEDPAEFTKFENETGLVLPEFAVDRYKNAGVCARVLELGKDCYAEADYPNGPWCKPGDYVVMSPYSGVRVFSNVVQKDLRFLDEREVFGTVPGPEFVKRGNA